MSLKQPTRDDVQDIFKEEISKAMDKEFGHVEEIVKLEKEVDKLESKVESLVSLVECCIESMSEASDSLMWKSYEEKLKDLTK